MRAKFNHYDTDNSGTLDENEVMALAQVRVHLCVFACFVWVGVFVCVLCACGCNLAIVFFLWDLCISCVYASQNLLTSSIPRPAISINLCYPICNTFHLVSRIYCDVFLYTNDIECGSQDLWMAFHPKSKPLDFVHVKELTQELMKVRPYLYLWGDSTRANVKIHKSYR